MDKPTKETLERLDKILLNQLVLFRKLCALEDKLIKLSSKNSSYKNYLEELGFERNAIMKSLNNKPEIKTKLIK